MESPLFTHRSACWLWLSLVTTLDCASQTDAPASSGTRDAGAGGATAVSFDSSLAGGQGTAGARPASASAGDDSGTLGEVGSGAAGSADHSSGSGSGGKVSGSGGANGSGSGGSNGLAERDGGSVVLPPADAKFDYQIGGAYTPPSGVRLVSRDRNDPPAEGLYNICYVNGFQIQPNENTWWQSNHPDLVLRDAKGTPVVDTDWNETLVDTSTQEKRAALLAVIGPWIAKCAADGYDAVEIDNLDSYARSQGLLTQANNIALMALLSQTAHAKGLAVGQKNSAELLASKREMGTDFAVAEECYEFDECGDYKSAYGDLVFVIEYDRSAFTKACSQYPELSIVLRDVNVTPGGTYDAC